MAEEGLAVGEVGVGLAGVGGGVVPAALCQFLLGELFELSRLGVEGGDFASVGLCCFEVSHCPTGSDGGAEEQRTYLPEVLPLVKSVLRRTPLRDVGIVRIGHCS